MANVQEAVEEGRGRAEPRPSRWWNRTRYNRAMKLARRVHLYTGLFMTPWVFLYGITALLFNHPGAFPDARIVSFDRSAAAGTPLADPPQPGDLARRVVEAINGGADSSSKSAAGYRLVRPEEASYEHDFFVMTRSNGQEHWLRLDLKTGEGTIRTEAKAGEKPAPFVPKDGGIKLDPPPMDAMKDAAPAFLKAQGVEGDSAVERAFAPDLRFLMEGGGTTWRATYNPQTGALSGRPESEGPAMSNRMFLLRLHLAHEYPSSVDSRWFWALGVDAMFLSMCGWGITGLLMWWQMKNLRTVGAIVIVASLIVSVVVAIGMHGYLAG